MIVNVYSSDQINEYITIFRPLKEKPLINSDPGGIEQSRWDGWMEQPSWWRFQL